MQVNFTKDQFRTLMELVYLGNWMLTSYHEEIPKSKGDYEKMESYIFSLAKEFGLEDLAVGDEKDGYFPSARFEDTGLLDKINDYNDYTLWDELADRLANRDLLAEHGEEALKAMTDQERFVEKDKLYWSYMDEFGKNGLDRFRLVRPEEE